MAFIPVEPRSDSTFLIEVRESLFEEEAGLDRFVISMHYRVGENMLIFQDGFPCVGMEGIFENIGRNIRNPVDDVLSCSNVMDGLIEVCVV